MSKFDYLISISEAANLFCKGESTIRGHIKKGKFIEGVDCRKFGKQWVFDIDSLYREYVLKNI